MDTESLNQYLNTNYTERRQEIFVNTIYGGTNIIEWYLLSSFIQYDRLFALSKYILYKIDACRWIDFYIDVNSILSHLFYSRYSIINYNAITSSLINMAIHYREFYRSRFGINCRIFIVYSNNFPSRQREILSEYNQRNYTSYINNAELIDLIKYNCELLKILCPYLEGIYFVTDQDQETAIIIKSIINKQNRYKKNALGIYTQNGVYPNVILSKDLYSYQLVAMESETFLFRPRKRDGEDKSWAVTKNNLYRGIKKELGGNVNTISPANEELSFGLISLFLSISGLKSRNIKAIHNFNKTLEILADACKNGQLFNGYNSDINYSIETLSNYSKKISDNKDQLKLRYNAIDLLSNYNIYKNSLESSSITSGIIDLVDPNAVREINNKFFENNPLDINRL